MFPGAHGRKLATVVGVMLAIALSATARALDFSLTSFGPVAAGLIILVVGLVIYNLLRHAGAGHTASGSAALIVTYFTMRAVTDAVIMSHLNGTTPCGIYLLDEDRTHAAAVDFDSDDGSHPLGFIRRARHYGIAAYVERSKSKGYHVWIFFSDQGISARNTRLVIRMILEELGLPSTEIFPKQDSLNTPSSCGNFINAPLFGQYVKFGRTVFLDEKLAPYPNQWALMEWFQRVPEATIDGIIGANELDLPGSEPVSSPAPDSRPGPQTFGLRPCAQRMLAEGVTSNQRVACFRLAAQLRKAGLPFDAAAATLQVWAKKNRPSNCKSIITEAEVQEQTRCAYGAKRFRSCGCEDEAVVPYCDQTCSLYRGSKIGDLDRHPDI